MILAKCIATVALILCAFIAVYAAKQVDPSPVIRLQRNTVILVIAFFLFFSKDYFLLEEFS